MTRKHSRRGGVGTWWTGGDRASDLR